MLGQEGITRRESAGRRLCVVMTVILAASVLVSFCLGRFSKVSVSEVTCILLHQVFRSIPQTWTTTAERIVFTLRLPRIIASVLIGASLSVSGASYQALFSNPVASSDTLGVTSSAAFGAILGVMAGMSAVGVKLLSFAIGCAAVCGVFLFAAHISKGQSLTVYLILVGMVVSSLFQAFLSILKFVADPIDQLPKITYWLMGSFSNVQMRDIPLCILFFVIGMVPLVMFRWRLNLLSLSDIEARAVGENINRLRMITVLCATLLTSSSVAMTGGISWVGLVIPHIARMIVGCDFRKLLPTSALMGSIFLLWMDNAARCLSVYELPISILTSIVGGPIFFAILIKNREQIANGT